MLRFLGIIAGGLLLWSASAMADELQTGHAEQNTIYANCDVSAFLDGRSETPMMSQPQEAILLVQSDPCDGIRCNPDEVCRAGRCVPNP